VLASVGRDRNGKKNNSAASEIRAKACMTLLAAHTKGCRTHIQLSRQLGGQLLCILCNLIVEVDVGGVLEQMVLPVHCLNNLRVAMTHTHCDNPSKCLHNQYQS